MQAVLAARQARQAARSNDPVPAPVPAPADARRSRILKELAKLAFDHPGPVLAQDFVEEDVKGSGQAYAPVVSTEAYYQKQNKKRPCGRGVYKHFNFFSIQNVPARWTGKEGSAKNVFEIKLA